MPGAHYGLGGSNPSRRSASTRKEWPQPKKTSRAWLDDAFRKTRGWTAGEDQYLLIPVTTLDDLGVDPCDLYDPDVEEQDDWDITPVRPTLTSHHGEFSEPKISRRED